MGKELDAGPPRLAQSGNGAPKVEHLPAAVGAETV
jgi:hypothetical protein